MKLNPVLRARHPESSMLPKGVPLVAISVVVVEAVVEAAVDDRSMFPTFVTHSRPPTPFLCLLPPLPKNRSSVAGKFELTLGITATVQCWLARPEGSLPPSW